MQEFIIQTNDPQSQSSNTPNDPATQQQDSGIPYDNSQPFNVRDAADDKSRLLVIILISTLTVLLFTIVFVSYLHFSNETALIAENPDDNILGAETNDNEVAMIVNIPDEFKDTFFYTDTYNIFSYQIDKEQSTQITDLSKDITSRIHSFQLINEDYIGFMICDLEAVGNSCKVFIHNLKSNNSELIDEINGDIDNIVWIDEASYLVSEYNPVKNTIEINLLRKDEPRMIAQIPGSNISREWFIEDSSILEASPDKSSFLYINTSSNNGFNFNVYIYNLEGELLGSIEDATQPSWIDDENIAFRQYSNKKAGYIYIFNLDTKQTSKLDNSVEAAYDPKSAGQLVAFWEKSSIASTYIYDVDKKNFTLIEEKTAFPVWLSNDEVILSRIRECNENECKEQYSIEYETQFTVESYIVKNVHSGYTKEIDIRNKYLENGIVTWVESL